MCVCMFDAISIYKSCSMYCKIRSKNIKNKLFFFIFISFQLIFKIGLNECFRGLANIPKYQLETTLLANVCFRYFLSNMLMCVLTFFRYNKMPQEEWILYWSVFLHMYLCMYLCEYAARRFI